jgi:hypothetical protein
MGPKTGLRDVEKRKFLTILGLEPQPLGDSARSQSVYRLSYPGSALFLKYGKFHDMFRPVLSSSGEKHYTCSYTGNYHTAVIAGNQVYE